MPGAIHELIEKINSEQKTPLPDLLRRAFYVSKQLRLSGLENWVRHELYGYNEVEDIPSYRIFEIKGDYTIKIDMGEELSFFERFRYEKIHGIQRSFLRNPISELEYIYNHRSMLSINIEQRTEKIPSNNFVKAVNISSSQMYSVLDSIRSHLMESLFDLLEFDAEVNSASETCKDKQSTVLQKPEKENNQNTTVNVTIGVAQTSSSTSTSIASPVYNQIDHNEILKTIRGNIEKLEGIHTLINNISEEMSKEMPDKSALRRYGESINRISEGVSANLISNLLAPWVQSFLQSLG